MEIKFSIKGITDKTELQGLIFEHCAQIMAYGERVSFIVCHKDMEDTILNCFPEPEKPLDYQGTAVAITEKLVSKDEIVVIGTKTIPSEIHV